MIEKIKSNWTAKLLAVIMAIICWLYVMNEQNPASDVTFTVPLQIRNVNTNLIVAEAPENIRLKLRGQRNTLANLLPKDIVSTADLRGLTEGKHEVLITTQLPAGVEIVDSTPEKATIRLEMIISRILSVKPQVSGTVSEGFTVGNINSLPEHVQISGPRALVESVRTAVAPIDFKKEKLGFKVLSSVELHDNEGRTVSGLTTYPEAVNLEAIILSDGVRKIVDVKPQTKGELMVGVSLKKIVAEPVKVELTGAADKLDKIEFIYTEPINITGVTGNVKRDAKLQLPDGIVADKSVVVIEITMETIGR